MLTDILDQNLCRQAGLDVMNFLIFLIRIALLKFCLHSLLNNRFTSTTKSFNTEEDFATIQFAQENTICLFIGNIGS